MGKIDNAIDSLNGNGIHCSTDTPLKNYTTYKIGGPAAILAVVNDSAQLEFACKIASQSDLPYKVLGNGSNVLVADSGFPGMIIINRSNRWQILNADTTDVFVSVNKQCDSPRYITNHDADFLHNTDQNVQNALIRVDSGVRINSFVNTLFASGITGLQWFAGIPGTIGGAVYMNIHGGKHYFGNLLSNACLFDGDTTKVVTNNYFRFEYDRSFLHTSKEIVLWTDLMLKKGNVQRAKKFANYWRKQKKIQPQRSAGCVFQNLSETECLQYDLSTSSVGFVIDKILGLKGTRIGDAVISPSHAAFIENVGTASAEDVFSLINLIREKAEQKIGLELKLEIELIGDFGS